MLLLMFSYCLEFSCIVVQQCNKLDSHAHLKVGNSTVRKRERENECLGETSSLCIYFRHVDHQISEVPSHVWDTSTEYTMGLALERREQGWSPGGISGVLSQNSKSISSTWFKTEERKKRESWLEIWGNPSLPPIAQPLKWRIRSVLYKSF